MDQPKFTKEETRSALWEMIDDKSADYWLDAFEAAVLAEALQPTAGDSTIRVRACDFASYHARAMANPDAGARLLQEFAESEVRLALQPCDPSPELAEAEKWLNPPGVGQPAGYPEAIAAELSRLRANEKRLEGLLQEYAYAHHNFEEQDGSDASAELLGAAEEALLASAAPPAESAKLIARPLSEWHEGKGSVLWWRFPAVEPPYSGSPLDDDFPDYVTHWTPIVVPDEPAESAEGTVKP